MKSILALSVLAVACNGGTTTGVTNAVQGTIAGQPINVTSAFAFINDNGRGDVTQWIALSDVPLTCANLNARAALKNARLLLLIVGAGAGGHASAASQTGAYPLAVLSGGVPSGNFATAGFAATDSSCQVTGSTIAATSGAVQLTSTSTQNLGLMEGTFTATLQNGDSIRGSFSTHLSPCNAADAGAASCQ